MNWDALFREQYPFLVRQAARILGNQSEGEDIAVEAFVRLMAERSAVRHYGGWLKRCVLHLALDRLRANHRRANREKLAGATPGADNQESRLIAEQEQARVRWILTRLPHRDAVLLMGRAEGCSYRELAEMAGIRLTSVGAMLAKAEERFKERYERHYGTR
ncbi:MAG: sigma-70 family RNA polymerase sigma factor [Bryobacterales bacterium]|nr:sigma-70 family RNA polymerase sigma factor [Bryobacterales bacterium]